MDLLEKINKRIDEAMKYGKSKDTEQALQRIINQADSIMSSDGWKSKFAGGGSVRDAYGPALWNIKDQAQQIQKMMKKGSKPYGKGMKSVTTRRKGTVPS